MKDETKSKAVQLAKDLGVLLGMETVKMSSELAEGDYELSNGTKFRITAEGDLVDVVAKDPAEAEEEEAARNEEEAVALAATKKLTEDLATTTEALELSAAKVTELETEVVTLTKTKKVVTAPKKGKVVEKIKMSDHMTYQEKVHAKLFNALLKSK